MINGIKDCFEEDALDLIIDVIKSAQGSYKNIYSGLFSKDYYNEFLKPHGRIADADGFYSLVVPHPWLGDFAMGMNFDAGFLYPEY